jgi:acetoin utilization deacetylase AcuC-like enzyme
MIIYDNKHKFSLIEFGIEIPVYDSRAANSFNHLATHPILGQHIDRWRIEKSDDKIIKSDLLRAHSKEYIQKLYSDALEQEIIKTFELIDSRGRFFRYDPQKAILPLTDLFGRILGRVAGTWQCCRVALQKGFCFYFGGGMHHAQKHYGNGFCIVNDIVIAVRKLQAEKRINTAWIIDTDAHKGDGTAALTAHDDSIKTLSIHMARGWPLDGEKYDKKGNLNPSFVPSDIDVPIPPGEDHRYVAELQQGLRRLDTYAKPDIAVVVYGADPYEKDTLPSTSGLQLSLEQLKTRDLTVYNFLKERSIPRAYLMAGGYGDHAWEVYAQFLEWALLDYLSQAKG